MAKKKFNFTKTLTKTGLNIGGGLVANLVSNKVMPNMNPKLKAGALLALAIVAPSFVKNEMVEDISNGAATVAGLKLASSFVPALAGYDEDDIVNGIGYEEDEDFLPDDEEVSGVEEDDINM